MFSVKKAIIRICCILISLNHEKFVIWVLQLEVQTILTISAQMFCKNKDLLSPLQVLATLLSHTKYCVNTHLQWAA